MLITKAILIGAALALAFAAAVSLLGHVGIAVGMVA